MSRKSSRRARRRSRRHSTTIEELVTIVTTEEDSSGAPRPRMKPSEQALERFAIATVNKGIDGLKAEFASLKDYIPPNTEHKSFDMNRECNRYHNIRCYDATRVILSFGVPPERNYVHANHVGSSRCRLLNSFICTQAPMEATVNDFWRMVWQEKSKSIVMLCKFIEGGKEKCVRYFPTTFGETKQYGQVSVRNVKKTSNVSEKVFESIKLNVCIPGHQTFELTLYKWMDWPDFGVPSSGMGMLRVLRQIRNLPGSTAIVHCSAGAGRSGTFVACEICLRILLEGKELNVVDVIKEIRGQRAGAVQTENQYVYLHRALCEYVNAKRLAREKIARFFSAYLDYAQRSLMI